jgi:hypothetical protein
LATGNNSENLKFVRFTSQSFEMIVMEKWSLLGRQMVTE